MLHLLDPVIDYIPQFDAVVAIISNGFSKIFSRFHWAALLSALALATLCWWVQRSAIPPQARSGLLAWMFPRSIWLHRSALLDYRFVLFDKLMIAALAAIGAMLFLQPGSGADELFSSDGDDHSLTILLAYTLALLVVEDFCRYWAHRIMHMSPLLWQFHKVHHSPEVLVPFSQMRSHPVNGIVNLLRSAVAIGSVTGVFLLLFPGELTVLSIFGINAGRFLFDVMGSNLRHSHVWLSFGPRLSYLFISPAQHQIHHSRDPKHFNTNYGSQFALWDWMFGTLYVPQKPEKLRFGIDRDSTRRMQSVSALYIEPFRDALAELRRSRP
ncbi:MAG: sterol desaturase family protein [Sphingomonadaceae bacterium]